MGFYKKQLVDDIAAHLDPQLVSFYNLRSKTGLSINDFVSDVMDEFFIGETAQAELASLIGKVKNTKRQRKRRWYAAFQNDINMLSVSDPFHPLHSLVVVAQNLSPDKYVSFYGDKTIDELIEEEIEKAKKWYEESDSFLVSFPGINNFTLVNIYKSLKYDTIIDIWKYIDSTLGGNIFLYEKKYPVSLLNRPIFSPNFVTRDMQLTPDGTREEVIRDDSGNVLLEIIADGKLTPPKSMDPDALEIMNFFILRADAMDMTSFIKNKTIVVNRSDLANYLRKYKPGTRIFDKISYCLTSLVEYTFKYEDDNGKIRFNLFDNIKEVEADRTLISVTFGDVLRDSVLQHRLIPVTSSSFNELKNPLAKTICFALKKEQIIHRYDRKGIYNYNFFQCISGLPYRNKQKNIVAIKESLDEFVRRAFLLESFTYKNNSFEISFLPLSEFEVIDLNGIEQVIEPC